MQDKSLQVLLIEDNPGDARLLREALADAGAAHFELHHVERLATALVALQEKQFDEVLLDLSLPDCQGMETVLKVHDQAPHLPIVVITGNNDEMLALKAVHEGVQDYLVKGQMDGHLLVRSMNYAIERKRAEIALRELNQSLEETNRQLTAAQATLLQSERLAAVGQLAAGVAHEINNPTSFVLSNLQSLKRDLGTLDSSYQRARGILLEGERAPAVSEFLAQEAKREVAYLWDDARDIIEESLEGMERVKEIVKDLRIFAGSPREEHGEVDVNQILKSTISMLRNQITYRARLIEDLGPLPLILANDGRLSQVFMNVIHNAIQAIPEGQAPKNRIEIRSRVADESIHVSVTDTGAGIAPEHLAHIFDPFFTTKALGEGTGLGLAISYDIVKQHGGKIEVESSPGQGATVTVILPLLLRRDLDGQIFREASGPDATRSPLPVARILLVDDEPHILRSYQRSLPPTLSIVAAGNGTEALKILAADADFDAVICDMMMPELSGDDVYAQAIKLRPGLARRFIFITGGAFTAKTREFIMDSNCLCLEKPCGIEDLIDAIKRVMVEPGASET